jgi:hypothetical protein
MSFRDPSGCSYLAPVMKMSIVLAFVKRDTEERRIPEDRTIVANLPSELAIEFNTITGTSSANVASHVVIDRLILRSHGPRISILPSREAFVRRALHLQGRYW